MCVCVWGGGGGGGGWGRVLDSIRIMSTLTVGSCLVNWMLLFHKGFKQTWPILAQYHSFSECFILITLIWLLD